MTRIDLQTPFLEDGIQNVNFFNGRILTGLAMQEAQQANRRQHQQLGQASGSGIVNGLTVSLVSSGGNNTTPIVRVEAGLAVNSQGQAVALPTYVEVNLVRSEAAGGQEAGLFAACQPPSPDVIHTGAGVYILVVTPASGFQGRAPMHSLNGNGRADSCGFNYAVEGVTFRLVYVDLADPALIPAAIGADLPPVLGQSDPASLSKLRNLLAHLCLGTVEAAGFTRNLYQQVSQNPAPSSYGVVDKLRDQGRVSGCDVPLALIYWTTQGVQIVDLGSVRRRLIHPALSDRWPAVVSDRRLAEGEATFLQFQEQMANLTQPSVPQNQLASMRAKNYFRFLPAVGIVPVLGTGSVRGVNIKEFFSELTTRDPVVIEGVRVAELLSRSWRYAPIDLTAGTLIWLYEVRENLEAIEQSSSNPPQRYLIFTTGYLPYLGKAQYDLSRWTYGNYDIGAVENILAGG